MIVGGCASTASRPSGAAVAEPPAASTAAAPATEEITVPVLTARPLGGAVLIDGKADDPAWRAAAPARQFHFEHDASIPAEYSTTLRAAYDPENIYFSFVCDEPDPGALTTAAKGRDQEVWADDCVEVFIDPTGEGRTYKSFVVNAANVQEDGLYQFTTVPATVYSVSGPLPATDGQFQSEPWDAEWQSGVSVGDKSWSVEIVIPFEALGISPGAGASVRANFTRNRVALGGRLRRTSKPEYSVWSDPKCDIHTPGRFGVVVLAPAGAGDEPETRTISAESVGLPGTPGVSPALPPATSVQFSIDPDKSRPFGRYWDGMNRAPSSREGDDSPFAKGYWRHIRTGDGMGRSVSFDEEGNLQADFSRADGMFDAIKKYNIRTVICLRSTFRGVRYTSGTSASYGRVSGPPADQDGHEKIYLAHKACFQHIKDKYGQEFLDSLRFEYMNEPNASERFFAGTLDDYCRMYDYVAKALKEVSPTARIGGPAVSGDGQDFTRGFLRHCREGDNAATGGKGAPLDFISFHVYGWRSRLCPMGSMQAINTLAEFWHLIHEEGMSGREVYVTEWGIEHTGDATGPYYWFRNTHYSPVWMANFVKQIDDAEQTYADLQPRMDGLTLCSMGGGRGRRAPFVGGRSIFEAGGVPKPYFNGYILLNELGNRRLAVSGDGAGRISCLATARDDGSFAVLVYHFVEYDHSADADGQVAVKLTGLPLAGMKVSQERVDWQTANSYTAWVAMGSPQQISDEQAAELTAAAEVHKTPLETDGGSVTLNMPVNSVAVVIVEPE
jgi:xylan 1,4-beta-xylosidase